MTVHRCLAMHACELDLWKTPTEEMDMAREKTILLCLVLELSL